MYENEMYPQMKLGPLSLSHFHSISHVNTNRSTPISMVLLVTQIQNTTTNFLMCLCIFFFSHPFWVVANLKSVKYEAFHFHIRYCFNVVTWNKNNVLEQSGKYHTYTHKRGKSFFYFFFYISSSFGWYGSTFVIRSIPSYVYIQTLCFFYSAAT